MKQQLNELYNCPCSKTCNTTFFGIPSQVTIIMTDAQATSCNLNQVDGNNVSIDTCCKDYASTTGPSGGDGPIDIDKHTYHEPLDIEPRDPRGPKEPFLTKSRLREIIRKSIREMMEKEEPTTQRQVEKKEGCWVDCAYGPTGGTERIWCGNCKKPERCCKRRKVPGSGYTE